MPHKSTNAMGKWWLAAAAAVLAAVAAWGLSGRSAGQGQAVDTPFDGNRAYAHLSSVVGFGPRPAGSPALAETRAYIIAELEKAGLSPQVDEFDAVTPGGTRRMANIRAVRPGARPETILLAGHYDTKLFDFPFVGANDAGSSTAWLLEMARVTEGLQLGHTLEFIFFDGEEAVAEWTDTDSLYGSRHDVDRRSRAGSLPLLKAMILVDMIGDTNLNISREGGSTDWLKTIIWDTAHTQGYTDEFLNAEIGVADDHVPYLRAGIPAIDIIDFDYPYWHTPADTLDKTSARSMKIVGDVIFSSLPAIDRYLAETD